MDTLYGSSESGDGHDSQEVPLPGWQGMTIKEILEKVDLFNITAMIDDEKEAKKVHQKDNTSEVSSTISPESAFLGPKVWNKPISLPLDDEDDDFSVMNIEDFLSENNIEMEDVSGHQNPGSCDSKSGKGFHRASNSVKGADTSFLYAESKAAKQERERDEKKNAALKVQIDFTPEDLALATIPGMRFDPRERSFSVDELRPQPIIRKRKKFYVPTSSKDEKYWEQRIKNNVAARRSREARRLKENQISLRAAFLERENAALREEMKRASDEGRKLEAEKEALLEQLKAMRSKLGC